MGSAIVAILLLAGLVLLALWLRKVEDEVRVARADNVKLATAVREVKDRLDALASERWSGQAQKNELTTDAPKKKMVPKPARQTWKTFKAAAEAASDSQEEA